MAPNERQQKRHVQRQKRQNTQKEQVEAICTAIDDEDYEALHRLAFEHLGFGVGDRTLRRRVWQCLLGISSEDSCDKDWQSLIDGIDQDGKEARVMQADVQRSVYSWDVHSGIPPEARERKRAQLMEVMLASLRQHPGKLAYFQGFHDIALVFLEVSSPSQAFHMVERLALFHLSDQLCCPFDQGLLPLLSVLMYLLKLVDPPVAQALIEAECAELHFAVPWILTWFSHSLPKLQQVTRLFDCLLASHPTMILYFSATVLLQHREKILATERELPEMVSVLQKLPLSELDADEWAANAFELSKQVPPESLVWCLPRSQRRLLPRTSPVFHFPHPWMGGKKPLDSRERYRVKKDMWKKAPVYQGGGSVLHRIRSWLNSFRWAKSSIYKLLCMGLGFALSMLCLPLCLWKRLWSPKKKQI
eukprot:TRINITY_DN58769_c0_g1_i1.p1 TRINITY_DN58769_c0_g1~~TRINITY_DN58769_c0_g1_i1.p1  ORF type:complete len:418 (+),score=55.92 TRINITY_DN58769_c0_g1_i1:107-1360(+)